MSWHRAIAHVDLDAFFASVEVLDNPSLRGKAVLVGGRGRRAVVAAASYEARRFGCKSAQSMAEALRRCPEAIVCPPRFARYSEISSLFFELLREFSPLVEGLSIDEGFLDLSGTEKLHGPVPLLPPTIQRAVRERIGLSCSVGLAQNKFLAKMASEINKPNGVTLIEPGKEQEFLDPLEVSKLWGVGKKTQARLYQLGIVRVRDIRNSNEHQMIKELGTLGQRLWCLAHGRDTREVETQRVRKQIGIERTFDRDIKDPVQLQELLLAFATELADRLVRRDKRATRIQVKLRREDFKTITRQGRLQNPTFDGAKLYRAAVAEFWRSGWAGQALRLVGLSVVAFEDQHENPAGQLSLDLQELPEDLPESGGEDRQRLISQIRAKFGPQGLFPAELAKRPTTKNGKRN